MALLPNVNLILYKHVVLKLRTQTSDLGFFIADFRQSLYTASAASIHHVRRSANNVAHLFAREARTKNLEFAFFLVAPPFVEEALSFDCNDS